MWGSTEGSGVDLGHGGHHFSCESARLSRSADQHVRPNRTDRLHEFHALVCVRVGEVVGHEIVAALYDQAIDVHEPEATPRLLV